MSYADILKKAASKWNCPDMMDTSKRTKPKYSFSSPYLNYATYGGIPRYAITEMLGEPGGGKSSAAIDLCCNAKRIHEKEYEDEVARLRDLVAKGKKEYSGPLEDLLDSGPKKILYVDIEHTFDFKWAMKMKVKLGDVDVMQPPDIAGEELLQTIQEVVESGEVGLIILDSIPTIVTKAELEKKYGERTVAALAGLMTIFLRKMVPLLPRYGATLVLINQTRPNMDNPYVINTPGGEAIKFYSSLRLYFRQGSPVDFVGNELPKSAEDPKGFIINVKIMKQKSAPNDRKIASFYLMTQSGIRPDFDYAKLSIEKYGIIKKAGGWFTMCDPATGEILTDETGKPIKINGQTKVYDYLQAHPDYYQAIQDFVQKDMESSGIPEDGASDSVETMEVY